LVNTEITELGCNHVLVQVAMTGKKSQQLILSECVVSMESNGSDSVDNTGICQDESRTV